MEENLQSDVPGWLGTMVINLDGTIALTAGDLHGMEDKTIMFFDIARKLGQYFSLAESANDDPFLRMTSM